MFSSSSGHFLLKDALRNNSAFYFTVHNCLFWLGGDLTAGGAVMRRVSILKAKKRGYFPKGNSLIVAMGLFSEELF
jgi:phage baseplate assembly protein gpV